MRDHNPTDYRSASEALRLVVLRGDGLTTTSVETLTGREIGIRLQGQRKIRVTESAAEQDDDSTAYAGLEFDADGPLWGAEELETRVGDELLIRRVHLTDGGGTVYAVGEVVAVLNRLPATFAEAIQTTDIPLGKGLVAAGVPFVRELCRWGGYKAGELAGTLGPALHENSVVPARTYRMVSMETREPLTVITEWFAPRLFERADGKRPAGMDRPTNPYLASR